MPRLLLVDDNPSIHKIAETLLSSSPIELVCVGSASEALMMLDSGERFDVALLDTAMPGMDGWELLSRMRKHPDSAYIPIAMMAGVLDTVDPEQLKRAPIQGFIKKPIELRELAERVQQLLATPVTLAEGEGNQGDPRVLSPFATVPGTKITSLPEFRGPEDELPPEETRTSEMARLDDPDDLLLLTPEDFWFEETQAEQGSADALLAEATAQAMAEAEMGAPPPLQMGSVDSALDLEELDLEALKDIPSEEPPTLPEVPAVPESSIPESPEEHLEEPFFGEIVETPAAQPEPEAAEAPAVHSDLLGEETLAIPGLAAHAQALSAYEPYVRDFPGHDFLTEDIPSHALADRGEAPGFEGLKPQFPSAGIPKFTAFGEAPSEAGAREESVFPSAAAYVPAMAAGIGAAPAGPSESQEFPASAPPVASLPPSPQAAAPAGAAPLDATALVQGLMSDPVLMEALTKAVVARLGDQALREIAWELMPELAEKLPR